jgi:hypothetical protein
MTRIIYVPLVLLHIFLARHILYCNTFFLLTLKVQIYIWYLFMLCVFLSWWASAHDRSSCCKLALLSPVTHRNLRLRILLSFSLFAHDFLTYYFFHFSPTWLSSRNKSLCFGWRMSHSAKQSYVVGNLLFMEWVLCVIGWALSCNLNTGLLFL